MPPQVSNVAHCESAGLIKIDDAASDRDPDDETAAPSDAALEGFVTRPEIAEAMSLSAWSA
jgi:hypothetical protein